MRGESPSRILLLLCLVGAASCGDEPITFETGSNATSNNAAVNANDGNANNDGLNADPNNDSPNAGPGCASVAGDIVASSDVELDPYRDLPCVRVRGSVLLSSGVSDLGGLAFEEIGGDLQIVDSGVAEIGLENLREIGGSLIIERNGELERFEGLNSLETVGHNLVVRGANLSAITGLSNLREVRNLLLADLPNVEDLSGFSGLRRVRGDFAIFDLPALTGLDAFDGLLQADTVRIYRNPGIASVDPLDDVAGVRLIEFVSNQQVGSLTIPLEEDGTLMVSGNGALADLGQISNLEGLQELWLLQNDAMEEVSFPRLVRVRADLRIESQATGRLVMPEMTSFGSFELSDLALTSPVGVNVRSGGTLRLRSLDLLEDLTGFEELDDVSALYVEYNPNLTDATALYGLSRIGRLIIRENPNLSQCQADLIAASAGQVGSTTFSGNGPSPPDCLLMR